MQLKKVVMIAASLLVLLTLVPIRAAAQHRDPGHDYWSHYYGHSRHHDSSDWDFKWKVVAKAQPDECFLGLGDPNNLNSFKAYYGTGADLPTGYKPCTFGTSTGTPKVNQAYVWGMTKWNDRYIWYGTIANTLCQVISALEFAGGGTPAPLQENTIVCEAGKNGNTDSRPPRIFLYDTKTKQLTDMTPLVKNFTADGGVSWARLQATGVLRSAGTKGDVVILGGLYGTLFNPSVVMFAFNAKTQTFLGSIVFDGTSAWPYAGVPTNPKDPTKVAQFSNIRQWLRAEHNVYVGVATGPSVGFGSTSGAILRWTGTVAQPFTFVQVGTVGADPAYLAFAHDRLFVNTWGTAALNGLNFPLGSLGEALYMSPKFDETTEMLPASTASWGPPVFTYAKYEVEPSAAMAGGAIAAFHGDIYFTTMTPPGAQALQFKNLYPDAPTDTVSQAEGFLGSYRPTAMFRMRHIDDPSGPKFDLLYGNPLLPQFVLPDGKTPCPTGTGHAADQATCSWTLTPNNMKQDPLYGMAGYNNPFNSYTWWMHVYHDQLFIGTFDWSYLAFEPLFDKYGSKIPEDVIDRAREFEGADLLRIDDNDSRARRVDTDGLENFSNYGIRNMVTVDDDLYIGTANPFNLLTDPNSKQYDGKLGGWELIRLRQHDR